MKKLGFIILFLVWPLSYYFKHIQPIFDEGLNQLVIDYFITFGYCLGTSLAAYAEFKKEANRWVKYMFWNVIIVMGVAVILTYLIDFVVDDLLETSKLIWSIMIATFVSLCIYYFKRN